MIKLLRTLLFLLLAIYCLKCVTAQGKTRGAMNLETKIQQLSEMVSKKSVLRMNSQKFREYVKSPPRNYSVIIIFTALAPNRQCAICRSVQDEYTIVANSFRYSQGFSNQLFFAMIDFDEGSEVFQMLRINTAPVIMHFPAKGKPKFVDTMDFQRLGISADAIAKWIQERTDIQIRVFRPPNYSGTVAMLLLGVLFCGFIYLRRNNLDFIYNKQMWAVFAVFFCFIMVSGQMWNQIRGPPFVHRAQNGGVVFIHGSSQGQFVLETYIIMALNAAIVVGMILLAEASGGFKVDNSSPTETTKNKEQKSGAAPSNRSGRETKKLIMAIGGLILMCIFFSLLLSIFRAKAQGYPYSFLFK